MLKIILNWHINASLDTKMWEIIQLAKTIDCFFGNYNSKDDLYEASSGLLVESLDVPPLALLDGGVHKNLEEGEAHFLFIKPPMRIFLSVCSIFCSWHIFFAYLWPTYRNKLLYEDKINLKVQLWHRKICLKYKA